MIDDRDIFEALKADKERGFRLLMDGYQVSLYNYLRRLLVVHDDALDALQETFIQVLRHIDGFRMESKLSTWLYKIATNEGLRILEKRKRRLTDGEFSEVLLEALEESEYVNFDDAAVIKFQKAILTLPEKQRLVFNLRYYDELEYSQIARITGISLSSVKVNYHYAKNKVKDYILNH